jgi:DNA polymerase-3 subunit chi
MAELWFYHLERASIEDALPELLTRLLDRGGRALVVSPEPERLASLDARLWTFRDDSFLPHGLDTEPQAPRQPVLLSHETRNVNGASMLFCLDGADPGELGGEEPPPWERVVVMFEDADQRSVQQARSLWADAKKASVPVSYWRQSAEGKWEKKA